jgi:Tfp pilus assembly protein PilN
VRHEGRQPDPGRPPTRQLRRRAQRPAVYVLLGVLAALVVLASAWGLTSRQVADRKVELAKVETEAQSAEARATALQSYTAFAGLRAKRVETVTSLSRTRFNWPYALREISRVVPPSVSLTTLIGTVAPGVSVDGASSAAASLRAELQVPAVELTGCTSSQEEVARYLARLRSIDGVTRVSLAGSEKAQGATGGGPAPAASGGGGGDDCRAGSDQRPKFDAVVFFERSTASSSSVGSGAAATPAAAPGAKPAASAAAPANGSAAPSSGAAATPSSSTPTSATPSTGSTK